MIDLEQMKLAVALALAEDGYIDIDSTQGQNYLNGEASEYTINEIDYAAESLVEAYNKLGPGKKPRWHGGHWKWEIVDA